MWCVVFDVHPATFALTSTIFKWSCVCVTRFVLWNEWSLDRPTGKENEKREKKHGKEVESMYSCIAFTTLEYIFIAFTRKIYSHAVEPGPD